MNKLAKYEFRGFKLLKANLSHTKESPLSSFTIVAQKANYFEDSHIYELFSEITFNYGDEANACLFSIGFMINDLEWLEVMAEQTVVNELHKIAFPFLRSKVFEYTTDLRHGVLLPVIDFSNIDVTKKIVFNINKVEPMSN